MRYYVRAVLERPGQTPLQCEREFEVEEPLDVNRPDLLVLRQNQIPTLPRRLNHSLSRRAHFGAHGANTILAPVVASSCASMSVFRKIEVISNILTEYTLKVFSIQYCEDHKI